jgi:hypothetical protein
MIDENDHSSPAAGTTDAQQTDEQRRNDQAGTQQQPSTDQAALDDAGQRHIEEQRKNDAENEQRQAANQPDPETQVREAVTGQPVDRSKDATRND